MRSLSWSEILVWLLAAFFLLGSAVNTFATQRTRSEYSRWGYPDWFHFVVGGLEFAVTVLLPSPLTRCFGVALGGAIMLAALATVVVHREYQRVVPPLIVFVLLTVVGLEIHQ